MSGHHEPVGERQGRQPAQDSRSAASRLRKWWVGTYFVAWYVLGWALIGVLLGIAIGVLS